MPGYSGTDVVLYASDSSAGELTKIGGQRNVSFEESHPAINISSKDTGRVEAVISGRGTRTVSLDGLVLDSDTGLDLLKDAARNGTEILVAKYKDSTKIESAHAIVTTRSEQFPDNAEATVSVELQLTEEWA